MAPINPSSACSATNSTGHATNGTHASEKNSKPTILHLGDPISYNHHLYSRLHSNFTIIRAELSERHRPEFIKHLKDKRWGDFSAIMRPFWNTGGEMGRWDRQLIDLLPKSMKVMASAGAGFDWIDTDILGERGMSYQASRSSMPHADELTQESSTPTALEPPPNRSPTWLYSLSSPSSAKCPGPHWPLVPTHPSTSKRPTRDPCTLRTTLVTTPWELWDSGISASLLPRKSELAWVCEYCITTRNGSLPTRKTRWMPPSMTY